MQYIWASGRSVGKPPTARRAAGGGPHGMMLALGCYVLGEQAAQAVSLLHLAPHEVEAAEEAELAEGRVDSRH